MKSDIKSKELTDTAADSERPPASAVDLMFTIMTEVNIIQQLGEAAFHRRQPNDGLHLSHFAVLNRLYRFGDPQTPQQLAAKMQVTKATMTNSLARLGKKGLVNVTENPNDKRSKLVFLTAAGRQERDAAVERMVPIMEDHVRRMDAESLQGLLPLLQNLHHAMDEDNHA